MIKESIVLIKINKGNFKIKNIKLKNYKNKK
jgi:hypothetical protein